MNKQTNFQGLEVGYDIPALPGMDEADIQTPCLVLDLDALERNIVKMGDYAKVHGMRRWQGTGSSSLRRWRSRRVRGCWTRRAASGAISHPSDSRKASVFSVLWQTIFAPFLKIARS